MKISHLPKLGLVAALSCATVAFAQNPFVGTWKIDYSKSHMTGDTMTFSPEANGKIHLTTDDFSYSFKTDGSASTDRMGQTEHWTRVNDHTLKVVTQVGPDSLTDIFEVSNNGKTLTDKETGTKPNGDPINTTAVYTRISPGKGLYGKWRNTKNSDSSPNTTQIEANGDNGIIWHIPEMKAQVKLDFNGTETSPVGPTVPHGLTLAATKTSPRSFKLTEKINGKLLYTGHFTVSADGKTMTESGRSPGAAASEKVVYQKVS